MGERKVVTSLKDLKVYRDPHPNPHKGHVDVQIQLFEGPAENDEQDIITVLSVRVYFTREDVPLADIIDSAFRQAHRTVRVLGANLPADLPPVNPESLWIE